MKSELFFSSLRIYMSAWGPLGSYLDFSTDPLSIESKEKFKNEAKDLFLNLTNKICVTDLHRHSLILSDNLQKLIKLLERDGELSKSEQIEAIEAVTMMSIAAGNIMALRSSAADRIAHSKKLLSARTVGRGKGKQAIRKQLILRLYAQTRSKWSSAHAAASGLRTDAIKLAKSIGYPLSEDRALKTLAEWFSEYEGKHTRNV